MKRNIYIALALMISVLYSCNQATQTKESEQNVVVQNEGQNLKLQVYYFHSTNRCPTCLGIQSNVKSVIDNEYSEEVEKGIIRFTEVNVDLKKNQALAERFGAYGSSLHMVQITDGVENDVDLTDYAFMYSNAKPDFFIQGINDTIDYFIHH